MSADNEVAIFEFGDDFGVIHLQGFDYGGHSTEQLMALKEDCKVFESYSDAFSYALTLEDELGLVEYGVTLYRV